MPPLPFVLFGHNHLLGDLIDIIHASGGRLKRIIQNIPEPAVPAGRKSLAERLRRLNYPVLVEPLRGFFPLPDEQYVLGFSGSKAKPLRDELIGQFKLSFTSLIHPRAIVSPTALVAPGCVINAGAVVASGAKLAPQVWLNRGCTIGHDTELGEFAVIQPGANVAGHVRIDSGAVVGMGANVIEDRRIGRNAIIAAGAVVIDDVPAEVMVAGVPAQIKTPARKVANY